MMKIKELNTADDQYKYAKKFREVKDRKNKY